MHIHTVLLYKTKSEKTNQYDGLSFLCRCTSACLTACWPQKSFQRSTGTGARYTLLSRSRFHVFPIGPRIYTVGGVLPDLVQDILCNDCGRKGRSRFHWLYHKCGACGSYNTRVIKTTDAPECSTSNWQGEFNSSFVMVRFFRKSVHVTCLEEEKPCARLLYSCGNKFGFGERLV